MKRKGVIFLVTVFFLASCSVTKKPIFVNVDTIKIEDVTSEKVLISAFAHFKNPNDVGGKLETKGIKVLVNDVEMAEVKSEMFKVPARKEFAVPMLVEIPIKQLQKKLNKNFLENLIGTLLNQKMKVQFKGQIKYKVLGYSNYYDVDESEIVKIKL